MTDPGSDTVSSYLVHWGDGNSDTYTAAQVAGLSGIVSHTYVDGPNAYAITVLLIAILLAAAMIGGVYLAKMDEPGKVGP